MKNPTSKTKELTARQEELISDLTKISGNEELARRLVVKTKDAVINFSEELDALLSKYIYSIKEEAFKETGSFDKSKQLELVNLIRVETIDEIVGFLLVEASDISVASQMRLSNFMYLASEIFEGAIIRNAYSQVSSQIMESVLKSSAAANPETNKDKLS